MASSSHSTNKKHVFSKAWIKNLNAVTEFYEVHQHTKVPYSGETRMLAKWVGRQRGARRYRLSNEEVAALRKIDPEFFELRSFRRSELEAKWRDRLGSLVEYLKTHSDVTVCEIHSHDPELATWVSNQRKRRNQGNLHPDRIQILDDIGFPWGETAKRTRAPQCTSEKIELVWHAMFKKLEAYKAVHGDCLVPFNHEDRPLALWVTTQRRVFKKKTWYKEKACGMRGDRKKLLEDIGFVWEAVPAKIPASKRSSPTTPAGEPILQIEAV